MFYRSFVHADVANHSGEIKRNAIPPGIPAVVCEGTGRTTGKLMEGQLAGKASGTIVFTIEASSSS
jgi:hypothetical protein